MICFAGKKKGSSAKEGERVKLLEEELEAIMYDREKQSKAYERDFMVFAFKEAEWKQEKRKLKEEVKRLKKLVEEKEEIVKGLELGGGNKMVEECKQNVEEEEECNAYWQWQLSGGTATNFLLQQMREERALRDAAADKWKKLYLAIKSELDDLIQNTHPGGGLMYRRAAEEEENLMIQELKMELKLKEETINDLKARLVAAEREEFNRAREADILRQSLRIIGSNKKPSSFVPGGKGKPNFSFVRRVVKVRR
ncbi:unnamed protein product [Linum tenue]|uniref:Uncharacterized protein n=1 Tax=Linum tenue TaxID=586396 RepID=A0AAV0LQN4_9ROSI|nr:unnamed protein product [Linum tenue]